MARLKNQYLGGDKKFKNDDFSTEAIDLLVPICHLKQAQSLSPRNSQGSTHPSRSLSEAVQCILRGQWSRPIFLILREPLDSVEKEASNATKRHRRQGRQRGKESGSQTLLMFPLCDVERATGEGHRIALRIRSRLKLSLIHI